jgi:MFS family permease
MIVIALLDCAQSIAYALMPAGAVPRPSPRIATPTRKPGKLAWTATLLLVLFAMPEAGMAMGHNSIRPFLPLFFEERLGLSTAIIGTVMASLALCGGIGALFVPAVAGRIGNTRSIGILRAFSAGMVALCFGGVGTAIVIALLFAYYSVADGTEATFITESMERIPTDRRTAFSGIYAMVWSASSFAASAASGALQDRPGAGFGAAFSLGIFGYAFSIFWITVVYPRLPRLGARPTPTAKDAETAREELVVARE